jgi:anti-sigma B factor antagonist
MERRPLVREEVPAEALTLEITGGSSESTVRVTGRVVIQTSPRLRARLLELLRTGPRQVVVIDVSGVTYLDTSGIATLLEASQLARSRGVRIRVTGLAGEPKVLAQVTELDHVFEALGSKVEFR